MSKPLQPFEMDAIMRHLLPVREAGFGQVTIQVQRGVVVYVTRSIGEQISMTLEDSGSQPKNQLPMDFNGKGHDAAKRS